MNRADDDFHAGDRDSRQRVHQRRGFGGADAPRPAVGQQTARVHAAEVAADGDVVLAKIHAYAERLQRSPANDVLQRVVSEQREVSGPASRSYAGRDGQRDAAGAAGRQRVQIRNPRRLQLGLARRGMRQAAETVHHQHDDLGIRPPAYVF